MPTFSKLKRNILYILFLLSSTLLALEIIFSLLDFKAGFLFNYSNFEFSEDIELVEFYRTDEDGIYVLSPYISDSLPKYYSLETQGIEKEYPDKNIFYSDGVLEITRDFKHLRRQILENASSYHAFNSEENTQAWNSTFPLAARADYLKNGVDSSMFLDYLKHPFNSDGYRGINLKYKEQKGKIKVMLVGDSFGWGMSAEPIFNSYADLLLAKGYLVFNFGISGTDPPQYTEIVRKYLPIIEPDIVVVNLYAGNDFIPFPREVDVSKPLEHQSNKGFYESNPLGEFLNFEDAYQYYYTISVIPDTDKNFFNKICSKSKALTQFWQLLFCLNVVKHPQLKTYNRIKNQEPIENADVISPYFHEIASLCKAHNTALLNVVTPAYPPYFELSWDKFIEKKNVDEEALDIVFKDLEYHLPTNISASEDYDNEYDHFNNSGSIKFANFIDSLIQVKLNRPE